MCRREVDRDELHDLTGLELTDQWEVGGDDTGHHGYPPTVAWSGSRMMDGRPGELDGSGDHAGGQDLLGGWDLAGGRPNGRPCRVVVGDRRPRGESRTPIRFEPGPTIHGPVASGSSPAAGNEWGPGTTRIVRMLVVGRGPWGSEASGRGNSCPWGRPGGPRSSRSPASNGPGPSPESRSLDREPTTTSVSNPPDTAR